MKISFINKRGNLHLIYTKVSRNFWMKSTTLSKQLITEKINKKIKKIKINIIEKTILSTHYYYLFFNLLCFF